MPRRVAKIFQRPKTICTEDQTRSYKDDFSSIIIIVDQRNYQ